jgi:hypothetical protein
MSASDSIIVTTTLVSKLLTEEQLKLIKTISKSNKITLQTKSLDNNSDVYTIKRNRLFLIKNKIETQSSVNGYIRMSTYIKTSSETHWVSFNVKFENGKKTNIDLHKFEKVEPITEEKAAQLRQDIAKVLAKKTQKIKVEPHTNSFLRLIKKVLSLFK